MSQSMFITREDSVWRKQKCYALFQTSHVKSALSIAADIITFVFTPSIGDMWRILGKRQNGNRGKQNPTQSLKCLHHFRPVLSGSLSMTL